MELKPSTDFGAKDFDGKGGREIHDHIFIGANTGLPTFLGDKETADRQAKFLSDKKVRVDIFGLREGGVIEGKLLGPLRPEVPDAESREPLPGRGRGPDAGHRPSLQPGNCRFQRNLGRADRPFGRSRHRPLRRASDADDDVDPYSHFINVYMLDRDGNRIDRRNPQDIFVPALQQADSPGRRPGRSFRTRTYPRPRPAPSPWKPESITASSTGPISTTSSARGRGPSCRWSSWHATRSLPVEGGPAVDESPLANRGDLAAL